ncbi:amino acid ABC transporter permease [Labrys sp. ZIDIC5]|uniref:amino acid ABC transporter permease n=1 Tax=Labrys sedimenti TaxID=3106036 RepID=UPI002ACAA147|nr:amino acid ABC transporter permease [Labrys sp. ZIDIC5]MDZ5452141.1 amino acid ABC transporter permease [Labrys sp. ZIDIC5]
MSVNETRSKGADVDPTIDLVIRPASHPWRWVAIAFVALLAAMLVHTLFTNPRFEWAVVGQYFTSQTILLGVWRTLELTAIAMVMGVALGVMLAVMRLSPNPILSGASWLFVWFFRGAPLLVQLLVWYNLSALFPHISLGIPFIGPDFVELDANVLITPYVAAILGLSLNEAAYSAEIIRAGIISIDHGQTEAAQSIGMSRGRLLRRVILPQAMRVIIPPLGNDTINMLKMSALVSIIAVPELLFAAQTIYTRTFETIPLLLVAVIWYLIIVSVMSGIQYYIERHYARGSSRDLPPTPLQSIGAFFGLSRSSPINPGEKARSAP